MLRALMGAGGSRSGGSKNLGTRSAPVAAGFRYHGEPGRQECPVRPVQVRAARLPLQAGELVAQDHRVWSSVFVITRHYTQALCGEMSSRVGQCLVRLRFPAVCLSVM